MMCGYWDRQLLGYGFRDKGGCKRVIKKAVHAKRYPCSNHVLNNSLAMSSKVTSCHNTSSTMRKVVAFANASAKRHQIFERELGTTMQGICETRWVERHDGQLQFQGDNLVKICSALEKISTCTTVSLSRVFQMSSIDLKRATDAINDTISVLRQKREQVNTVFQRLFDEAKELAEQLDVEIKCPRLVSRQVHIELIISRGVFSQERLHPSSGLINDLQERLSP
ncbi:unnamed protein product [Psylliodes chrysocephalus]|uniref:Uncharacterized protein n=1 Tax=Psylliodes chrysocephalus TaxID=3402493 RepID=A0A9P0GHJ6_9CUCU|nr:unnamed protein product [Psylliodes chrysocephala]